MLATKLISELQAHVAKYGDGHVVFKEGHPSQGWTPRHDIVYVTRGTIDKGAAEDPIKGVVLYEHVA